MSGRWHTGLKYATDHAQARFLGIGSTDYIEVTVQLAEDELFVFDTEGKAHARWRYADIVHAFAEGEDMERVLTSGQGDVQLVVLNPGLFDDIRLRVPGLRRRFSEDLHLFWDDLPDKGKRAVIATIVGGGGFIALGLWSLLKG